MRRSLKDVLLIKELAKTRKIFEISKELGIERHVVSKWIKRDYLPGDLLSNRAIVRNNPFEDLNNRDVMYYLGLIVTDGNIHKDTIKLALKESDLKLIEDFRNFVNPKLKISKTSKKIGNRTYYGYRTMFKSRLISKYFLELGIPENKSFTVNPNFKFTWDFIRGVIDGDGTIGYYQGRIPKISIFTASIDFANRLKEFFNENNIKVNYRKEREKLYIITTSKKDSFLQIYHYLYNNTQTYLQRKFERAEDISNSILQTHQIQGTSVRNPELSFDIVE
jgi:hypothetical protein